MIVACIGRYSLFSNTSRMKNLETLLITSKIESAIIIFFTIVFKTGRFSLPVNLFVYFFLLSMWNRITKVILENTKPANTVNAELAILLSEYFVTIYATTILTIKPMNPESSRFLFSEIVVRYFL